MGAAAAAAAEAAAGGAPTSSSCLWAAFSKFGEIAFHRVMTDRETGESRGFGFVSFKSEESANKAVAEMDGSTLDGRTINCNMAKPKEAAASPTKSWGGNGGGNDTA